MTDREKAIVMAYTGSCMLTGDKFQIFHKYIEDIMGRPIMTHEIGWLESEIKEKAKADFIALCADEPINHVKNGTPIPDNELGEIESRLGNVFEEIEEGILADNRLMAVSGMSIEELTDAFTKGYRLVSPDKANDQVPNMRVTKVTIDEARIVFQLDKETEGKQSENRTKYLSLKNATNGDVIRALFPNLYSYDGENYVLLDLSGFCGGKIEEKWWDAPYKAESMTNGDVIKGVFPNAKIKHGFYGIEGIPLVCLNLNTNIKTSEAFFVEEWWNAPYKESEQKNTEDDLK